MASSVKSIGIIGAGIAGLSTAKILKSFGFDVTVFEKEAEVGGVWSASRRYPGLTTQNPRTTYEFSDYPMPSDWPEWPAGKQVQSYLESYAKHFGFYDRVLLQAEVERVEYNGEVAQWFVHLKQAGQSDAAQKPTYQFDFLIACNGIFSLPSIPPFEGRDQFIDGGGLLCHTSQFTNIEQARGKHVLVVGYGKSSCDVANSVCDISASTQVIARTLIWKMPKKLKNILNFKYLFLTRLGEGLFRYVRLKGFEKFLHGRGLFIRNGMLNSVEAVIAKQLKLDQLDLRPKKPLESIARSTVSLVTEGFYEKIQQGKLVVRQTFITQLRPGEAVLSGGEVLPADIIICGTGWHQSVPFFSQDVLARICDSNGNFRLYQTMMPVAVPKLAFNGYNSSFFSQLNCEIGALWLADYLLGGVSLPSEKEMNDYIDERLAWMEERTDGKHSKGTNIIPFSVHQMDEILNDMRLPLSPIVRLQQWFLPVTGSDYRPLTKRLQQRYGINSSH
ncbi:MAG: NAD(P)/FAD-dependent oxidoreductase [Xanthomonadales bacterium]|nr:NAD(P)/FAD-dependent oxidoreductase [Xanthomonadales bacterium]